MGEDAGSWALTRLRELEARLNHHASAKEPLRAAGVGEKRIAALYPFDIAQWSSGIFDLTVDADNAPIMDDPAARTAEQHAVLLLNHERTTPRGVFQSLSFPPDSAIRARILQDEEEAEDPESFSVAAGVLHVTILLLAAIGHGLAELPDAQAAPNSYGASVAGRWDAHFPSYRLLVDNLAEVLAAHDWCCLALRAERFPGQG